jgi:hypothetical protein
MIQCIQIGVPANIEGRQSIMKDTDKFLIGIVVGVLLLVGVALALVWLHPKPTYRAEDTPEGVAYNYLLALQEKDYTRAYGYLLPTLKGYPASVDVFTANIRSNKWSFALDDNSVTLAIQSVRLISADKADVSVKETHFYEGGFLFGYQYASTFQMELQRQDGAWKIVASDRYFASCWNQKDGCK